MKIPITNRNALQNVMKDGRKLDGIFEYYPSKFIKHLNAVYGTVPTIMLGK